jgi:propionyl-CoA carboxylase beta chain
VTHEDVTMEELGGADTHSATSGVAHFAFDSEPECLQRIRDIFRFIPSNNLGDPPRGAGTDPRDRRDESLLDIVPDNANKPYDMHEVINRIVDDAEFYEVQSEYAANIICGFAHIGGFSVGIVANQPAVLAGVLDINASLKAARYIRFCDAFNIPIVTFEDVPGFLPGVTVITRKAYGGAYDVMSSKHIRGDFNVAWPTAEIAVMGPKGAVEILFRKEIAESGDESAATDAKIEEYREKFAHPYIAAGRGYVDDIIDPRDTRPALIDALESLQTKRDKNPPKKHGNIPL